MVGLKSGKRKRIEFCPNDEVPSIQTTVAFIRHDANGSLKKLRLKNQREMQRVKDINMSEADPAIEYLERYLQV